MIYKHAILRKFYSIHVPLPPLNKQQEIAAYLDTQCGRIDKIVDNLNDEIPLSAEYRTRLISDVVTGKVDVRGVFVPEYEAVEDVAGEEDINTDEEAEAEKNGIN